MQITITPRVWKSDRNNGYYADMIENETVLQGFHNFRKTISGAKRLAEERAGYRAEEMRKFGNEVTVLETKLPTDAI